jgi:phosphate-selective porin OprO/OprP
MKNLFTVLILLVSASLRFTPMANAQDRSEEIEEIKRQIEEIKVQQEEQINQLKKEIEELEAQGSPPQSDIQDRMVKYNSKIKDEWHMNIRVGYDKGLFAETVDGDFYIKMNILGQFQFSVNESNNAMTATDFDIRRFRIKWSGNAFRPWFLYTLQIGDDGDGFELIDAYFTAGFGTRYGEVITPRAGQFKVPFTREELTSAESLQFVDRSIVNREFGMDRERGTAIYGVLGQYITYGSGIFNGSRRNGKSDDSNLVYVGRIQFTPCCGKLVYSGNSQFPSGGSYAYVPQNFDQRYQPTFAIAAAVWGIPGLNTEQKSPSNAITTRFNEIFAGTDVEPVADVVALTTDINFKFWLLSIEGDYEARWIKPKSIAQNSVLDHGFRVQGGVFLVPKFLELAGRYAWISYDNDVNGKDESWAITPGLNFYFSRDNRWKVQLDYSFIKDEDTEGNVNDQNQFRAQLQAFF